MAREEIVYVQKVRETLQGMNYCENKWRDEYDTVYHCEVEHLCQDCQDKLYNLLEWADLEEGPEGAANDNVELSN